MCCLFSSEIIFEMQNLSYKRLVKGARLFFESLFKIDKL